MSAHYRQTVIGMAAVFAVVFLAAALANSAASDAKARLHRVSAIDGTNQAEFEIHAAKLHRLEEDIRPVHEFSSAWNGATHLPEKNAAEEIRSELESIAQRQLGLVTDNAITPQPDRYIFQAAPLRVQRVTLRASGKDLSALLAWLGKVEEKYPAALVELCEFSSNVGGSTGLTIRLVQPLHDNSGHRAIPAAIAQDTGLVCESIRSITWPQYTPARLKTAIAVGFPRNPLQPAVIGEPRPPGFLRDSADEITPRLETAVDGKIRSVIRGAAAIVVIDGRVLRVGDELVLGNGRERPIPGAKTKLKAIEDDRLIFHVAGGTIDKPIQCEVSYALPSLLRKR